MKVLLIDVNCKSSSTGQIVYNLYSYLNSRGDEAAVCYGRGKKIEEKNIFKFGLDFETYFHAFLTRITGYTGCFSYFSTKRLIRFIESFKPDIVHIHELHAYFVNIKQLLDYLAKKKIKVIHTLHCEFSFTGKCGHSVECEKWKTECQNCTHLRDYPSVILFDHTKHMQRVKQKSFAKIQRLIVVTPSQWLENRVQQSFFSDRSAIVIHNGIDTNVFKPVDSSILREELGIKKDEKVVLALAPNLMSKEKGGAFVLQIAQKLNNYNIRFIMVGVNKPEEVNVSNGHIIVKGRIYDKKLLTEYYSLADIFLICSERENFPTTCLEAQACGTPVCGFRTGGVAETLISDELLVDYGNISKLVNIINNQNKVTTEDRIILSSKAKEQFGLESMMKKYMDLYKTLISSSDVCTN